MSEYSNQIPWPQCKTARDNTSGVYVWIPEQNTTRCVRPTSTDTSRYSVPVYGYISPILITITLVTNGLICVVLTKKSMHSSTNVLLLSMAVSDMLTGIIPSACFVRFYTMFSGVERTEWDALVPYDWCFLYKVLIEILPTICHTASIWLTVVLALQRYLWVCRTHVAKRLCTVANTWNLVIVIYIVATLSQLCRFFDVDYLPFKLVRSDVTSTIYDVTSTIYDVTTDLFNLSNDGGTRVGVDVVDKGVVNGYILAMGVSHCVACVERRRAIITGNTQVYFNMYYGFRVIFIHLIPCTSLVVLNSLLVQAMSVAQRRRNLLIRQNRRVECRRLKESNLTTLMLVVVVGLFLLVEVPLAILLILIILDNTFKVSVMQATERSNASLFINLCILFSYPINFFIYCAMSRQFRETFLGLFRCSGGRGGSAVGGSEGGRSSQLAGGVRLGITGEDGVGLDETSMMMVTLGGSRSSRRASQPPHYL